MSAISQRSFTFLVSGALLVMVNSQLCLAQLGQPLDWPCDVVPLGTDLEEDRGPVATGLSLQPMGSRLAVVGDDNLVRVCDRQTGKVLFKLQGHDDWVRCVHFTPDGVWLLTAGYDRKIVKWNPSDGELVTVIDQASFPISTMCLDPQGRFAAVAGFSNTVLLIDWKTGNRLEEIEIPCGDLRSLAVSPDGQTLAAAGRDGRIYLWDLNRQNLKASIPAHQRRIRDLQFTPDGGRLISCGEDLRVRINHLGDDSQSFTINCHPSKVFSIQLLDSELLAAAGTDNKIRVWDLKTRGLIGTLIGHEGSVTCLEYDGSRLYSTGYDTFLRIWRANPNFAALPGNGPVRVSRDPQPAFKVPQ